MDGLLQLNNLGNGYHILRWMWDKVEADEERARALCQRMLENGFIARLDGEQEFIPGDDQLYQFYEDREKLPANMIRSHNGTVKSAIEESYELVKIIEDVYREAIVETDTGHKIVAERALISSNYENYIWNCGKLANVELNFYSTAEAYCFFLNVYQWMYIHWFLRYLKPHQEEDAQSGSLFTNIRGLIGNQSSKDAMFYNIGGYSYNLDELKHGVIRGNRKKPGAMMRTLNKSDDRAQFIPHDEYDLRSIFLCLDLPQTLEHVAWFNGPESMDKNFDPFLTEFLNTKVEFDPINAELTLPNIFETYKNDFGASDYNIVEFIWNWYENTEYTLENLANMKNLTIKYYPMIENNRY